MEFDANQHQHRRFNPLKGEWILISPHRLQRPWNGRVEVSNEGITPEFDPSNPLCPGVVRPNGKKTADYTSTYVFENDYPALLEETPHPIEDDDPLFRLAPASGVCKVMCFHPKSNITIPRMTVHEIKAIINGWVNEFEALKTRYTWVQIFENKGDIMGCSNPHPHCQIWASSFFPNEPRVKDQRQLEYFRRYGRPMLADYVERELKNEARIVSKNDHWVALVPFWAGWPYETMLLPRFQIRRLDELDEEKRLSLAKIMKELTTKYDNLFKISFPYSMGWHGAPTGPKLNDEAGHWVLHAMYYPPLLRSATVKKFMVGYELLAEVQRDLTPEKAARTLREQSLQHYESSRSV